MKALVTGSAGMIGTYIAETCLKRGWQVSGIDVNEGTNKDIEFYHGSILDKEILARAMKGCDYVFHEAAFPSSRMFIPDPAPGVRTNVEGSMNVFKIASDSGVAKVIAASTSSIYGRLPVPWREDVRLESTPNIYAATKLAMEYLATTHSSMTGLPILCLRYFSIYGYGDIKKGNTANILSQMAWDILGMNGEGKRLEIYGDGTQSRDMIFGADVAEANVQAALSNSKGGVYNIGSGKVTTFNDLFEKLCHSAGVEMKPYYAPNRTKNYISATLADMEKTTADIGFSPSVGIDQGVKLIVDHLKSLKK